MTDREPTAELDPRFGDPGATPTPWAVARAQLESAKAYWLSTVRVDGRPHVTTIAAVWVDGAVHFTTGPTEQKARNLETNQHCVVTTGSDRFEGLDVVVEGEAVRVRDEDTFRRLAAAYIAKYGDMFVYEVRDGEFRMRDTDHEVLAFEVRATKAFGFGKGEPFSQTRYRF